MNAPDPKANTTTEAYLAYKAGYLEESELKPVLYEPYLHFDAWLAYWAGLTNEYPFNASEKNVLQLKKYSASGIDVKLAAGGMIRVAGTTQSNYANFMTYQTPIDLKAGAYTFSRVGDKTYAVSLTVYNEDKTQYTSISITAGNSSSTANIDFDIKYIAGAFTGLTVGSSLDFVTGLQLEAGSDASEFETSTIPEMLCDEEALVAYLSGVTDTYPEDIKDPYDVRIVGYLKHLASIRWPEPDYPVNNEEFYLSTMEPTHTSNPVPSSDIELDTAEGKIISVEAYGDTYQQTYSGKNLYNLTSTSTVHGVTGVGTTEYFTLNGTVDSGAERIIFNECTLPAGTYTATTYYDSGETTGSTPFILYKKDTWNAVTPFWGMAFTTGDAGKSKSYTFTLSEETSVWFVIYEYENGIKFTDFKGRFQLESGSASSSFEPFVGGIPAPNPDYPQDIQVVTGEQTVEVTGKNIVNLQGYSSSGVTSSINGDGSIAISGTATSSGGVLVMRSQQPLKAGTYTMTISRPLPFLINFSVANGVSFRIPAGYTSVTTTLLGDYIDGGLYMAVTAGTTYNETFNLQVVAGSTPDYDFETYHLQSYTVDLGPIELCNISNYQDKIFNNDPNEDWYDPNLEDNAWYVKKQCGALDMGNDMADWSTGQGEGGFYRNNVVNTYGIAVGRLYSNIFTYDSTTWAGAGKFGITATGNLWLITGDSTLTTSTLPDWLSNKNAILYYILATPTDTKITDASLIGQLEALAGADAYNEKTFIGVTATDPNLPALLKVEAYKY